REEHHGRDDARRRQGVQGRARDRRARRAAGDGRDLRVDQRQFWRRRMSAPAEGQARSARRSAIETSHLHTSRLVAMIHGGEEWRIDAALLAFALTIVASRQTTSYNGRGTNR